MTDEIRDYLTTENTCITCGKKFIIGKREYEYYAGEGWNFPKRCRSCRKEKRRAQEERQDQIDAVNWKKQRDEKQREYELRLKLWDVKKYTDILPDDENTLYIIGNGFDLMHGVNSSYYSFRDSLVRTNSLRTDLETFLTVEDIWADFEEALAHLDIQFFSSRMNTGIYLDGMGAYEEDAGMSEFYGAADGAVQIVSDIVNELPRRFYAWISKLTIETDDRPLQQMFCNGKVLNFNYTEFVEQLYGIPEENICYIHGCRRKKKGSPREKLILGHAPGASDSAFDEKDNTYVDMRDPMRRAMINAAQDVITWELAEYDQQLTKDCKDIINNHKDFFESLNATKIIITIGHSFSKVDWPYFAEIISSLSTEHKVQWCFGCYELRDLENLDCMLKEFQIARNSVSVFRTDIINVTKNTVLDILHEKVNVSKVKVRDKSADGKWNVQTAGNMLQITDNNSGFVNYEVELPGHAFSMCFSSDSNRLIVNIRDFPSGILLFGLDDGDWKLIGELEAKTGSSFFKSCLNRILIYNDRITFVYNNRVSVNSLQDGSFMYSRPYRGAKKCEFPGEDVTEKFIRGYYKN